nr:EscE/YscE/SsaE family type III secretion system needle protein co-chaperone [Actinoplanes sichuanensis]
MLNVEDWAEIRRLRRSEGMAIKAIARRLKMSRNTVKKALASDSPPRYQRAAKAATAITGAAVDIPVDTATGGTTAAATTGESRHSRRRAKAPRPPHHRRAKAPRPPHHRRAKAKAKVGSGRVGSGRVGSGRVGSGRVGSGRVGSGRVGSGRPEYGGTPAAIPATQGSGAAVVHGGIKPDRPE